MEGHLKRMATVMRLPRRNIDSVQKLVTRICVDAIEMEMALMAPGQCTPPDQIIAWALAA